MPDLSKEQRLLLAICKLPEVDWWCVAREAQRPGGLYRLLAGDVTEESEKAVATRAGLQELESKLDCLLAQVESTVRPAIDEGAQLTTVLDDDYPTNLRVIFNLPPFLFYRGSLHPNDAMSVAVVGTRDASPEGLERATRMTLGLANYGVTILSGLAKGIDTAAHTTALKCGARTIGVLGSGILWERMYPPENCCLAEAIATQGAVVSQFWPQMAPTRYTFPRRNIVTSGLGQGTIVVEASRTSGAKMQARLAVEHGKKVFLLRSLVTDNQWARKYVETRGAIEVNSVEDVLKHLRPIDVVHDRSRQVHQEALALEL